MFLATLVVTILFALVLLLAADGKLTRDPQQMTTLERVGFPERYVPLLAAAEISMTAKLG